MIIYINIIKVNENPIFSDVPEISIINKIPINGYSITNILYIQLIKEKIDKNWKNDSITGPVIFNRGLYVNKYNNWTPPKTIFVFLLDIVLQS